MVSLSYALISFGGPWPSTCRYIYVFQYMCKSSGVMNRFFLTYSVIHTAPSLEYGQVKRYYECISCSIWLVSLSVNRPYYGRQEGWKKCHGCLFCNGVRVIGTAWPKCDIIYNILFLGAVAVPILYLVISTKPKLMSLLHNWGIPSAGTWKQVTKHQHQTLNPTQFGVLVKKRQQQGSGTLRHHMKSWKIN